jgi:hypothetical protein
MQLATGIRKDEGGRMKDEDPSISALVTGLGRRMPTIDKDSETAVG